MRHDRITLCDADQQCRRRDRGEFLDQRRSYLLRSGSGHRPLRASRHRRPSGRFGHDVLLEKAFDQFEDAPVADQVRHSVHQTPVRDRIEVLFQIGIHHPGVAVLEPPIDLAQGVPGASAGPEAVAAVPEPGFQNGFDHQFDSRLHDPVLDAGHMHFELHSHSNNPWDRLRLPIPSILFAGAGSLS
jgi:hypothetical protein